MQTKFTVLETEQAETIGFSKLDDNRLCLRFGNASIELHHNGNIVFANSDANITMQGANINIKNPHANIELATNGDVLINGEQVQQKSQKDTTVTAKGSLYLNS